MQNGFHLRLTPSSHHIIIISFLWREHLRFSNIQVYSTVLFTTVTKLCIRSPGFTHLWTRVTMLHIRSPSFFLFFFSFPPHLSLFHVFLFFFCLSLASFPLTLCKDTWVFRFRQGTIVDAKEGIGRKENIGNLGKSMVLFYVLHTKQLCPSSTNYSSY